MDAAPVLPSYLEVNSEALKFLIVDDDEVDSLSCRRALRRGFDESPIDIVTDWNIADALIQERRYDVYIVDQNLGSDSGLDLIRKHRDSFQDLVFILLTGQDDRAIDLAAAEAGASDYIVKADLSPARLERSIRYAIAMAAQKRSLIDATRALEDAKAAAQEESRNNLRIARELEATQDKLRRALVQAEESERRFRHLAQHDALTGLPNRMLFADRLHDSFATARRDGGSLALLQCDLDRFRHINDTIGHQAGDFLLGEVAGRIAACVQTVDTVARYGGDEFAVLLTRAGERDTALHVAERIAQAVGSTFEFKGMRFRSGISIGIALLDDSVKYPEDLIYHADLALNRSKEDDGRSIRMFDEALNAESKRVGDVKRALATAVHREELYLNYQPKIDILTGEINGLEALARWRHPTLGQVSPGEFIPVAESCGDILMISEWITDQACQMARELRRRLDAPLPISVNVSPIYLKQGGLPRQIELLVAKYGIDPAQLEVEITETSAVENLSWASDQLQQLRDIGVTIAIDDFGTGYSSLAMATKLPADVIKIDQTFVSGMLDSVSDAAAVNAAVSLAHSLGMYVIAEGVETTQQLAFLKKIGCNSAQGYLIGRPMDAETIVSFCMSHDGERIVADVPGSVIDATEVLRPASSDLLNSSHS